MELQPELYDVPCTRTLRLPIYPDPLAHAEGYLHQSWSLDGEEEHTANMENKTRSRHLNLFAVGSPVVWPTPCQCEKISWRGGHEAS